MFEGRIEPAGPSAVDRVARQCGVVAVGCTDAGGVIDGVAASIAGQITILNELQAVMASLETDQRQVTDATDEEQAQAGMQQPGMQPGQPQMPQDPSQQQMPPQQQPMDTSGLQDPHIRQVAEQLFNGGGMQPQQQPQPQPMGGMPQ